MPRISHQAKGVLQLCVIVLLAVCAPPKARAQDGERAAIRGTVEKFFAAEERKDLAALMSLWSERSPDFARYRRNTERDYATPGAPRVLRYDFGALVLEAGRAKLRLALEVGTPGAPVPRKRDRVMQLVKEGAEWKVWRFVSSEEALAEEIIGARTADDRRALLEEAKSFINAAELVRALGRQGRTPIMQGDYEEGLRIYRLADEIARNLRDEVATAVASGMLGILHYTRNEYPLALEYYQTALRLAEGVGDKAVVSHALNNIGAIYYLHGDNMRALEYYQKSLRLAEEAANKVATANALNNIGSIHASQGHTAQALEHFQKSLKLVEETGVKPEIAIALENIGATYQAEGDYQQALRYMERSLKVAEEVNDKSGIARALTSIGVLNSIRGDHGQALEYYQRSLKLAEELGDREDLARALNQSGRAYLALGKYGAALEAAQQAASKALEVGLPRQLWRARTTAGLAHRLLGQPGLARAAFLEAITTVERLRDQVAGGEQDQQRFFEDKIAPYHAMMELAVERDDPFEALSYAERAKGRVLLDVLSRGRVDINKAMTAGELERSHVLTTEIASLNARISALKREPKPDGALLAELEARLAKARLDYESFQSNLYAAHPELKVQRGQPRPLARDEVAALLADGKTALLEYACLEDRSYLFVMTRAGGAGRGQASIDLRVYPLDVKSKELGEMTRAFLQKVSGRDLGVKQAGRPLFDLLIKPAERQLLGVEKLCIVPDGPLWELPFQALGHGEKGYLLEQYAVFYAPSLTVLREMVAKGDGLRARHHRREAGSARAGRGAMNASPRGASSTLFAIGNPRLWGETVSRVSSFDREEPLNPLPDAEKEVNALAGLYGRARSKVLIGDTAREEAVKAQAGGYRVLHLATHAQLDDRNPMYSRIVLSRAADGGPGEDGLLEAWEITKLNLTAEMVVLSACQTARGRVGAGEGTIGMSWALFVAGSPAAVVSQWKVGSAVTADLMVEFHRNLLRERPRRAAAFTKAEALREAALKILRGPHSHPFYWAGFVLIGDEK
ncbi:MAG TPA: CHAT domain-containing protein [Pyrinomonadaceae bacterium]|nr:CHAT domain-containing protein [Pyrinomonadaceae bacterium]